MTARKLGCELALVAFCTLVFTGCPFMFDGLGDRDDELSDDERTPIEENVADWPPDADEIPPIAQCGGPSTESPGVVTRAMSYDIEVRGEVVSAIMEVKLCGIGEQPGEVIMRFPLPRGAVIHRAEIFLALQDRWEEAETVGRREGEMIYDDIVHPVEPEDFNDPLLIQQIGLDLYRARLFPVDSWVGGRFRVHYTHLLERTDDGRRLQIALEDPDALPFDPTYGLRVSVSADADFWETGTWEEGLEHSHRFDAEGGSGGAEILLGTIDQDLFLRLVPRETLPVAGMLRYEPSADEVLPHTHIHWTPSFDGVSTDLQPQLRNVVFVVDVSGSMSGRKIAETKQALVHVLNELSGNDWFGLIAFDDRTYTFRGEMTSGGDVYDAIRWVQALAAGGSTGMMAGLIEGTRVGFNSPAESRVLDLMLITDGMPNNGTSTPDGIIDELGAIADETGGELRISACAIGYDLDQDFVNALTLPTGGEATFALDDSEVTGQIIDLFDRVRGGGLDDVTVLIEGDETDPFELRRMFPGTTVQLGHSGVLEEEVQLSLAGYAPDDSMVQLSSLVPLEQGSSDGLHRLAAPLAAKAWSNRLERRIDEGGETEELVDEAVVLARRYGIITRYTSMLALESPEMYDEYDVQRPPRDPAGIALGEITSSRIDESRIGGEGAFELSADAEMIGCGCRTSGARGSPPLSVALFIICVGLAMRRARRRPPYKVRWPPSWPRW